MPKNLLKGIKFESFIDPCKDNDWGFWVATKELPKNIIIKIYFF